MFVSLLGFSFQHLTSCFRVLASSSWAKVNEVLKLRWCKFRCVQPDWSIDALTERLNTTFTAIKLHVYHAWTWNKVHCCYCPATVNILLYSVHRQPGLCNLKVCFTHRKSANGKSGGENTPFLIHLKQTAVSETVRIWGALLRLYSEHSKRVIKTTPNNPENPQNMLFWSAGNVLY